MIAGLLIGLGAAAVIVLIARHRRRRSIAELRDVAARLGGGDLGARVASPRSAELRDLARAMNDMAERLDRQMTLVEAQRQEQQAILESMGSGMLALDVEQRVISMNRAAERILGVERAAARGRLVQEVAREPELHRFIGKAMRSDGRTSDELHLRGVGAMTVEAIAEVLRGPREERAGLLVVMRDITHLRKLETIRTDFAANVSHELRTPITSIKGYAETLLDLDPAAAVEHREFLDVIYRNAVRLEAIVEDLLALARLEHDDAPSISTEAIAVDAIIETVVAGHAGAARAKEIAIEPASEPGLFVAGARQLLEQAVGNLLANAIAYSGPGTTVRLAGRPFGDGTVAIEVIDQGPGIDPQHLDRLFERFYRVDRARSRAQGGTGLGLAIVKHIARVHGGRAEVESTVGRGSTFRLVLPVEP